MQRPGLFGVLILSAAFWLEVSEAEAQVAGTTFTTSVFSLSRGLQSGTMAFNSDGSFLYLPAGSKVQAGAYTETVDSLSGNSSLTIVGGTGQPVTGLAIAWAEQFAFNGNLPVTLLYGISGNRSRFYVFVGYSLPTLSQ